MRFSAPRISKAIAGIALISVASLIAISLLADAGSVSAWMEERRVHLGEDNQYQTGTNFEIDENAAACSILGKVEITIGGELQLGAYDSTLGGANAAKFNFNDPDALVGHPCGGTDVTAAKTNELMALESFNHEAVPGGVFTLTASTDGTLTNSATVNVTINDVNEAPFFVRHDLDRMSAEQAANYCLRDDIAALKLTNPPIIRINENAAIGSVIADYDACDQDDGDDFSFAIRSSPDSAYFDIHTVTGQLIVERALDYELKPDYVIEVEVSDAEFEYQVDQRIRLNDIAEPVAPTPTRTAAPVATPTRTPGNVNQDVLRRVGALERLLATLQTLIQSLQSVIVAQDSRIAEQDERIAAQDSRIAAQDDKITAQDTRIAALEAQLATTTPTPTPTPLPTATPTPLPTATPSPTPTATPEPTPASNASACVQPILPGSVSGSWSSACLTANPTHGNTYYARFYTFTLDAAANVTITLTSDKPPYLYLLAGAGTAGDMLQETGDGGQTSATITDTLRAGSYTIEATTWNAKTLGNFTLTLSVRE